MAGLITTLHRKDTKFAAIDYNLQAIPQDLCEAVVIFSDFLMTPRPDGSSPGCKSSPWDASGCLTHSSGLPTGID